MTSRTATRDTPEETSPCASRDFHDPRTLPPRRHGRDGRGGGLAAVPRSQPGRDLPRDGAAQELARGRASDPVEGADRGGLLPSHGGQGTPLHHVRPGGPRVRCRLHCRNRPADLAGAARPQVHERPGERTPFDAARRRRHGLCAHRDGPARRPQRRRRQEGLGARPAAGIRRRASPVGDLDHAADRGKPPPGRRGRLARPVPRRLGKKDGQDGLDVAERARRLLGSHRHHRRRGPPGGVLHRPLGARRLAQGRQAPLAGPLEDRLGRQRRDADLRAAGQALHLVGLRHRRRPLPHRGRGGPGGGRGGLAEPPDEEPVQLVGAPQRPHLRLRQLGPEVHRGGHRRGEVEGERFRPRLAHPGRRPSDRAFRTRQAPARRGDVRGLPGEGEQPASLRQVLDGADPGERPALSAQRRGAPGPGLARHRSEGAAAKTGRQERTRL